MERRVLARRIDVSAETTRLAIIAPLRFRLAAMAYDALVVLAVWVLTVVALVRIIGDAVVGAWVQSVLFVELYALLTYCWCKRGQTLGMLAWRLRLVSCAAPPPGGDAAPPRVTPAQALRRFVAGLASFAALGLGFCWMWFDRERKSWPDRFSRSVIVREDRGVRERREQRR